MIALAQAKGVHMKKNGRAWFGLCPFHNDKNPSLSINPKINLWQCFGCRKPKFREFVLTFKFPALAWGRFRVTDDPLPADHQARVQDQPVQIDIAVD